MSRCRAAIAAADTVRVQEEKVEEKEEEEVKEEVVAGDEKKLEVAEVVVVEDHSLNPEESASKELIEAYRTFASTFPKNEIPTYIFIGWGSEDLRKQQGTDLAKINETLWSDQIDGETIELLEKYVGKLKKNEPITRTPKKA